MKRVIIAAPALAPEALAELKEWLGITTSGEDATLTVLLNAALESCEAFTGALPIESLCEEVLPVCSGWTALATRPVEAITQVEGIPAQGARFALAASAYAFELASDGTGMVRTLDPGVATRIAVRFTAGFASGWTQLPQGLRHGVIRLAAYQYRQRETAGDVPHPPAAVAALWRPWRRMRLA